MHQTSYRSALGAAPRRRPAPRLSGVNSRVQDTAWLISNFGQAAPSAARSLTGSQSPTRLTGVNSRVQDTAWLLAHAARPAPAAASPRSPLTADPTIRKGAQAAANAALTHSVGLSGVHWLTQALVIALGSEYISKALDPRSTIEQRADMEEAAAKLSDPFEDNHLAVPDRVVSYPVPGPFSPRMGLGYAGLSSGSGFTAAAVSTGAPIASAAIQSGSSLASSSTWLAAAGGPIGAAVAGTTIALAYLFSRKRPARKVATTEIVDSVEPLLQENLAGYLSGPRTVSSQQQAIANFEAGWAFVRDNCGIPDMGKPGEWCINDRKRGGQWDWFARYLDPIKDDPNVVADPPPTHQAVVDPVTGQTVFTPDPLALQNLKPLLIAGALALIAWRM